MKPKTYPLCLSLFMKIILFGILLLFTLVGIVMVWYGSACPGDNVPSPLLGVAWLTTMLLPWLWALSMPYRITVGDDGLIEFKALLRTTKVDPATIVSIKPDGAQMGFLIVTYQGGKLRLIHQFDDFHELLGDLKEINPSIVLRGC